MRRRGVSALVAAVAVSSCLSSCLGVDPTHKVFKCDVPCAGCCDENDKCHGGQEQSACGSSGQSCSACASDQVCQSGACVSIGPGDGGSPPDSGTRDAGFSDAGHPDAGPGDAGNVSDAGSHPDGGGTACDTATPLTFTSGVALTSGTTQGDDTLQGSCGNSTGPEHVYVVTLSQGPARLTLSVGAATTGFTPVVYVRSPCLGTELGCAAATSSSASLALSALAAGTYYVIVDGSNGSSGSYALTGQITLAGDSCAAAIPLTFVGGHAAAAGSTSGHANNEASSCGGASSPDVLYSFSSTQGRTLSVTVTATAGSTLDPVLVLDDTCPAVVDLTCAAPDGGSATLTYGPLQSGSYYFTVDGLSGSQGAYALSATLQ